MKLSVREDGLIELEEVYNPIVLKTKEGKEFGVCMRDYGIEVTEGDNSEIFPVMDGFDSTLKLLRESTQDEGLRQSLLIVQNYKMVYLNKMSKPK